MKEETLNLIKKEKLIVIVRGIGREKITSICEALYKGGVRLVEVTFDHSSQMSKQQTVLAISELSDRFRGKVCIGAGTVTDIETAQLAASAGAKYIISPNVDREVISFCNENDIISLPGAMTPTEIVDAYKFGADMVKVFPSDTLGIAYIKAVRAPLRHIPMLAVGGVDENNIADFLRAGVDGVGIGSNIMQRDMINKDDFAGIEHLAQKYVSAIRAYKTEIVS